jgi:hypothetical protein
MWGGIAWSEACVVGRAASMPDSKLQPLFQIVADEASGSRRFVSVSEIDVSNLAAALAPRIRNVYFRKRESRRRLREGIDDLNLFSSTAIVVPDEEIESALEEELDAVLPAEWHRGRPRQTDVQRSELAEIIAAEVFSALFSTTLPAVRISGKEIPDQQTRGIDLMGMEDVDKPSVTVILGEVKGSCEQKSPPQVVADMALKLKTIVADRRALIQEFTWLRDHSDKHAKLCNRVYVGFLLKVTMPNFILAPILVRSAATAGGKDAGVFRGNGFPNSHAVRFVRVTIMAEDLFKFAVEVYRHARRLEKN